MHESHVAELIRQYGVPITVRTMANDINPDGEVVIRNIHDTELFAITRYFNTTEVHGLAQEYNCELIIAAADLFIMPCPFRDELVINNTPSVIISASTNFNRNVPLIHRLHIRS